MRLYINVTLSFILIAQLTYLTQTYYLVPHRAINTPQSKHSPNQNIRYARHIQAHLIKRTEIGVSLSSNIDSNRLYLKKPIDSKEIEARISNLENIRFPEFGVTSTADVILNVATAVGGAVGGLILGGVFEGYAAEMVGAAIAAWMPLIGVIVIGR